MANKFNKYVCIGDTITREMDGVTYTARLEHDSDTNPRGFRRYSKRVIGLWETDKWMFIGIIVNVNYNELIYHHVASLWGIEANRFYRGQPRSDYIQQAAVTLIDEAMSKYNQMVLDNESYIK